MRSLAELLHAFGLPVYDKPSIEYDEATDTLLVRIQNVRYLAVPLIPGVVDVLWYLYEMKLLGVRVHGVSRYPHGPETIAALKKD